jgi:hypothetical protein
VRNAASAFLAVDDPSSKCLFLAAECLDLEGLFTELGVAPEFVDEGLDATQAKSPRGEAAPQVDQAGWASSGAGSG